MTWKPDELPNPHLAEYLDPQFTYGPELAAIHTEYRCAYGFEYEKLGFVEQVEVAPLRAAHLKACHLPADYDDLSPLDQRTARKNVLSSWFDPKLPNVLVSHLGNFVAACYLWVEEYSKAAQRNLGTYYYRDPLHKYDMIKAAFGPSKNPKSPAKTIITAPRGSTKTKTLIGQVTPMIVVNRPYSEVLVSEINEDRTIEETTAVQRELEENERIHADFGGKGVLFPATYRGTKKWVPSRLDLIHLPGCSILGRSWNSKQRGRHPKLWIIDDPEDPTRPMQVKERRNFWVMLFRRGLPMLAWGNIFLWISTRIRGGCCERAMAGCLEDDDELRQELHDVRFDDWNVCNFDLIMENEDGTRTSRFPDHISVQEYEERERVNPVDARSEYRGLATMEGDRVFPREKYAHHYMHCIRRGTGKDEEYFLDLATGRTMPWDKFIKSLYVAQATDIANSTSKDACYGAVVTAGVDAARLPCFYVLDCFLRQCISDQLVWAAYEQSARWNAEKSGWETGCMQDVVVRYAKQFADKLQAQGQPVPKLVTLDNHLQGKVPRIIASLRVLYANRRIRFPWYEPVTDSAGVTHYPAEQTSRKHFKLLLNQLDMFTDEGANGPDDGPDALQMVVRVLRTARGYEPIEEDQNANEIAKWAEGGVSFNHAQMDMRSWTPEMWEALKTCEPEYGELEAIYD